jgi:hypothetical protein
VNRDDDDFEAQVRLALGEHAADARHVDLAGAAMSQARGIRRRRTALSAAAVLVTVAVAVPVGAQITGRGSSDHTASEPTTDVGPTAAPKPVRVELSDLSEGDAPKVAYIDGATFVDSAGTEHPADADAGELVTDAAALSDGTLLWKQDEQAVITYTVAGGGSSDLPQGKSVTPPAIDQGTKAAVFAIHHVDAAGKSAKTDTLVYAAAVNGGAETVDTGMRVRQVMGAFNGQVVFNAVDKGEGEVVGLVTMAGGGSPVSTPWTDLKTVTAVSPDQSLLAGLPSRGNALSGEHNCAVMVNSATTAPMWSDCAWNPVEFSPDGTRVLGLPHHYDGLGPTTLAVLDSETGAVLQEFRTQGTFGRATFDGDSGTVVAVVAEGDQASIVRCSIEDESCELATPIATVIPDEPDAVLRPYQLTAN